MYSGVIYQVQKLCYLSREHNSIMSTFVITLILSKPAIILQQ